MTPADAPKIRSDEKVALVLGAGGARGLAQIGVIEALEARGVNIVAIAGSSSGALVGGLHACGKLHAYRDWLLTLDRRAMLRLLDPGFGRSALFEGTRLIEALREIAGSPKIEDLPVDFTAVAVDVMRQREVWLREGDMWDAIRASFAIPGLFTPHMIHGRALVDGGLLAPLPIAATRLSDAHRLIAVDMHGWPQRPPGEPAQEGAPSGELPKNNSRSWLKAWMRSEEGAVPVDAARARMGFTDLMSRSLDTMQAQISRVQLALDPPELVIRIPRDACQFYEFWRVKELIGIGRREADKALDAAGY
jgi:NTE family protein